MKCRCLTSFWCMALATQVYAADAPGGFWSFEPATKADPPIVQNAGWVQRPLDRFVLAKLEAKGLKPVGPADLRTLIRRATFDLTGLPPTPDEVAAFLAASANDPKAAYASLIDRLLASPHYGEAQARHWLDVARYAEDQAHTFGVKPNSSAFRYRDWVIESYNQDLPYDRFVKYQIAADLMDGIDVKHRAALGFFGLGAQYYKNTDAAKAAADELDDRVDTLSRGFLGLTVSCARCHDHKFDPIPTQDYYSIAGIFWSSKLTEVPLVSKDEVDRYQEGQKRIQAADKKVKDLLQSEKNRFVAAKADELPAYFVAAWKLEAKRLAKPDTSAAEQAKLDKLDASVLDRFVKYLNRKNQGVPALDAWHRHLPKTGTNPVPTSDVTKAAETLRDAIKATIGKPMDKPKSDMMQSLFGDKGVFPITDAEVIKVMTPECKQQFDTMKQAHADLSKNAPPAPPSAHGLAEGTPVDLKIYIRGNPAKQGELAPRRFLRIVAGDNAANFKQGSGRLELAEAIANSKNPLTARVMVNRLWQQHFGRGIVGTPSNFGNLGERPTHPELLDYLAVLFMESGWSIKQMHREIMLSATYQMSSANDANGQQIDPDNRWLWRMNRQRLQVESWRDAMLAVSGRLDRVMGGPTTNVDNADNNRRTIYAKISRHDLSGFLRLFDFPDANITADRRSETTVPQQQLFVMNSQFMVNQARAFAARMQKESAEDAARIRNGYLLAFGRPASDDELSVGLKYLSAKDSPEEATKNKLTRWERYAQALLASNEFMYVD